MIQIPHCFTWNLQDVHVFHVFGGEGLSDFKYKVNSYFIFG